MKDRIEVNLSQGVADVRLSRPDKLNALDFPMFEALVETAANLSRDRQLRAVVISGAGRAFCAGIDLSCLQQLQAGACPSLLTRSHGLTNIYQQAVWAWHELPVPVIAAVHGVAYGGGLQLALGADFRYASPQARCSILEVRWGLIPDMCGTKLMRGLVREDVIRELTYTGGVFSAHQAATFGFVTALHEDPLAAALSTAQQMAALSPSALRAAKRLLNSTQHQDAAAVFASESALQDALLGGSDQVEAMTANLQNRAPQFRAQADLQLERTPSHGEPAVRDD